MAIFNAPDLGYTNQHSGTWGNLSFAATSFSVPATAAINDKVRFLRVPKGAELVDCIATLADGPLSATLSLGWEYVDVSATDVDFFFATASYASGPVIVRKTNAAVTRQLLAKDAYIIGTILGAGLSAAVVMDIAVQYRYVGLP